MANLGVSMTLPSEDDFVEVSKNAPVQFGPGMRGAVVSVAKCRSPVTEESTGIPVGDYVIWVGILDDGKVVPKVVPEIWLRVVDSIV